ncbi:DUF1552 domain-containing protein [Ideonella azotifigens]|uniref:DUF1552 domain-containing protein n=1 Tax=Ideonella azotifigens TaxID=513160 RepID=A0ABN1KED7_9BURK|nr:DUF1552 domain-containing protein [Ideonella azotifigens]MCD2340741.1 DUF1552 domain-containing protein [Ideonella azotifigens]
MKPAYNPLTRRQFLIGGGTALALPLLPSLLPREARAAAQAALSAERYFVHMTTWHGVFQSQFYGPLLDLAASQTTTAGGVAVRGMPLQSKTSGDKVVISDILSAAASALSPRMLSRMNVINGLDYHTSVGHNRGYSLGGDGGSPSIDQVLARSTGFYPARPPQGAIVRNLVSLSGNGTGNNTSTTQTEQTAESNVKLFDRLFGTTTTPGEPSIVLVDRVKEHADLVMSDPACSADCRNRLSNYLDLLSDVQGQVTSTANGSSFPRPTTDTSAVEAAEGFYGKPEQQAACEKLWNDIVAAAFAAGISRVYVCGPNTYTFGPDSEFAWHNNYAHALDDPARRAGFNAAVQLQFEGAMLNLANKLDQITTADGATIFDKTLLASAFELGSGGNPGHHHNRCIPVVSLGNAGGYFKTGQYLDYRDLTSFSWSSDPHWYSGLIYNQWMGMILRAMGVTRSEQETTVVGYPNVRGANGDHTDAIWNVAGQDLPWLRA